MCFSTQPNNGLSPIEHNEEIPIHKDEPLVNVQPKIEESLMKTSDSFPMQIKENNSVSSREDQLPHPNSKTSSSTFQFNNGDCNQSPLKTITNDGGNINERNSSFKKMKVYFCNNTIVGKNIFANDNDFNQEQLSKGQCQYPIQCLGQGQGQAQGQGQDISYDHDIIYTQPTIFQSAFFQPKMAMIPKKDLICYTDSNNEVHLRNNQSDEEYASTRSCTCSKTKCLKKYCECFANNQYCVNCNCKDCENNPAYKKNQLKEMNDTITCTCTKSNCNKKYCECFKGGKGCNDQCRCINCCNKQRIYKGLTMERISVLIENSVIYITITQIIPEMAIDEKDLINSNQLTSTNDTFKRGYTLNGKVVSNVLKNKDNYDNNNTTNTKSNNNGIMLSKNYLLHNKRKRIRQIEQQQEDEE